MYRFFVGFPRPRHVATGSDFAGEVAAVGEGVTTFRAGDRALVNGATGAIGSAAVQLLAAEGVHQAAATSRQSSGPGSNLYLALLTPMGGGRRVRFPFPLDIKGSLLRVLTLLEQGKFRPVVDRHYGLSEIRDAFAYVASGQKIGSVILTPS